MQVPDVTPDPPSASWRAVLGVLQRLPQAGLSRGLGRLADIPLPALVRRPALEAFARTFGIDVSEAARPLDEYETLNAFFVRRLADGAREWPEEPGLASPVDGIVGETGRIDAGRILQAKGRSYAVADLLGDPDEAARYRDGRFITLYLSPRHYHRIHAPLSATIPAARYVPGGLLPVNAPSVSHVPNLFARNERLLCLLDVAETGRVALVAVGAYNVGRISAAFDRAWSGDDERPWVTNRTDDLPRERSYDRPVPVERGDELMAFHLGSTVILLTEPGRWEPTDACRPGREVRLGELLARPVGEPDSATTEE